ncbi:MAG: lytic transglycosylase domain-containing protein [Atopobiaceae bacterium]|nr:lytic transglycosylase domain-containing protein [Atopobiaceae bacterium]
MSERVRFWRWYRTVPIFSMAVVAALCLGVVSVPSVLLRHFLFPVHHEQTIVDASARHGLDPLLVCAVIKCESNWSEQAVSDAGAIGLMQMMPATSMELAQSGYVDASVYDPSNLGDPATNIEYGCAYLQWLQHQLSSTDEVIAAYNAGPGSVTTWLEGGGNIADVISFPETALYLKRVNETYARYQQLYDSTLNER